VELRAEIGGNSHVRKSVHGEWRGGEWLLKRRLYCGSGVRRAVGLV
jgi:hypothetical protein